MSESMAARTWLDRTWSRRSFLHTAGVAGVGAAALLAGCGSKKTATSTQSTAGGSGAIKRGGTITSFLGSGGASEDFETNGARSEGAATQTMLTLVYNGLLRLKVGANVPFTDRTLEGALAASWEQPDPQTLVFKLRPGVRFHNKPPVNGRTVTAADVKFTYERMLQSTFAYVNFFNTINSIDATDAQTVTMKLKAPDASLLAHISAGFGWIIAREAGKADSKSPAGLDFHDASTAIGTGPFMVDSYVKGVSATFVRNPNYFESGLPYVDRVEYAVISDTASQIAALQTGQVIIGALPSGGEADFTARNPKMAYGQNSSINGWYYTGRVDQKPFTDVRVRRAMAMVFDQDAIKKVWGTPDTASSYGSLTAINGDFYLPLDKLGDAAQWWKLDQQGAKQLLAAAGYPNGFETDVNSSNCCGPQFLEDLFASSLAKAGIKSNIKIKEHAAYQATTSRGIYDGIGDSQVPVFDPNDWFALTNQTGAVRNIAHLDDSALDDLIAKQRSELDSKKRLDIVHQMVQYCAGQCYYLVEPQIQTTEARQPFIKNYSPRLGYQPTYMVAWLDK